MRREAVVKKLRLLTAGIVLICLIFAAWMAVLAGLTKQNQRIPVLIYHDISAENITDRNRDLTSGASFAAEMEFLHDNGYQVIPLKQLISHMQTNEKLPEKALVITFDDGYEGDYKVAYPILKKYNMPATIFLIANRDQYFGPDAPPMLTWEEMREMEGSGLIDIQAHTYDLHYPVYTNKERTCLKPATIARAYQPELGRRETEEEYAGRLYEDFLLARTTIEANLHNQVDTMAWPFGAYNLTSLRIAREAGFKYFATTRRGTNEYADSVQVIRRISEDDNISPDQFAKFIEPDYSYVRQLRQVTFRYLNRLMELFI
ncbi:MAG: Poly-beta-1,6-N-acetyl-D-glucosamine N-deacetylase precursor [Pelotomaculum sp. PtaB.Bin013]|uniref:Polysaccharide deacetylase family protein n=1 Tax=Pelotomaculum isophthalicicum JI TaxID=947010 RepID=A0A9X4H4Q6_9FIRM|nr:polysaccharide deacetylase family protein [Pelotomaculum isophthalicicum]MDF9406959.1 polysaccharide deacetylase family protein [Pelotomaculum isophthalicicum JI]OPX86974.1 MAG: Poly-beta-1,6-N-acetyl-D-glucosamine N-deacetylase precursor [Pelotomaculum sp. PtaB.Bin013]